MANHKSAEKAHRQSIKKAAINKSRISRMKTFIKKVEAAIVSGDNPAARIALSAAQSEIMRAAKKNVLKFKTASRKIERLAARVKAMVA
ncbi:MAG: 30S ribosomal protein S20 [Alphaproteobacteria bacterium]|nr:30S ribosomal protein S20 [Alphaproteobacteria bacterium]OJV16330.1 MAG: 30S ribosomal protein S20 [Alphaproteobacteria bacterium 33-17]